MKKGEQLYEGKAKLLYATDDPDLLIQYFKDDATAFNAKKRGTIAGKGAVNCQMSTRLFRLLEARGVPTHLVEQISEREQVVRRLEIVPVEVVVRNLVAGSLAKRLGLAEGSPLGDVILEYFYKSDELDDPMINLSHVLALGYADRQTMATIDTLALKVNDYLKGFWERRGVRLIDFKLEFGLHHGNLMLGDEITPDGCRLWEVGSDRKLDKDRFRRDLGQVEETYAEVGALALEERPGD